MQDRPTTTECFRPTPPPREKWSRRVEFVLSCIGFAVGLGNIWRFPYLCYKNGGGAFLIPYLICLLTGGIPIFFLEVGLGQFMSEGGITVWNICPLFKGIGYGTAIICFVLNVYYIVILAWATHFLYFSFSQELPWGSCNNWWNTDKCFRPNEINSSINTSKVDAVVEYWERRVLGISGGIEEVGSLRWELVLSLLVVWILVYFCIWKGIKSSGKVVYFTAIFPYFMLTALLIRGVTLDGALQGIQFYVKPDFSKLLESQVTQMPWSSMWSVLFFFMILLMGLDSQFVGVEGFITALVDLYPMYLRKPAVKSSFIALVCLISFFIGLTMVTNGGMYVFQLFDFYGASGMVLLWFCFFECVSVAYFYGVNRFYSNIQEMIGYKLHWWLKLCWLVFTPLITMGILIFSSLDALPLKYNRSYIYPAWATKIGFSIALIPMLLIPIFFIYEISRQPGNIRKKWKQAVTPLLPKRETETPVALINNL